MSCLWANTCRDPVDELELGLTNGAAAFYKLRVCKRHQGTAFKVLWSNSRHKNGQLENYDRYFPETVDPATVAAGMPTLWDLKKVLLVLRDIELFRLVMGDFIRETDNRWGMDSRNVDGAHLPLAETLRSYEGLCWFSSQRRIMAGILSYDDFYGNIQRGQMVKDPGPGPRHGEFSHRLQWHYLMRVMTNGFSVPKTEAWSNTPLELYCKIGSEGVHRNVWGAIFESSDVVMGKPGDPNFMNSQFLPPGSKDHAGTSIGDADGFAESAFGRAMTRRFGKRKDQLADLETYAKGTPKKGNPELNQRHGAGDGFTGIKQILLQQPSDPERKRRNQGANKVGLVDAMEYIIQWRKAGLPPDLQAVAQRGRRRWLAQWTQFEQAQIVGQLADHPDAKWAEEPELEVRLAFFYLMRELHPDEWAEPKYERLQIDGTTVSGLLLHAEDGESFADVPADQRMEVSRLGLNDAYEYDPDFGAAPSEKLIDLIERQFADSSSKM